MEQEVKKLIPFIKGIKKCATAIKATILTKTTIIIVCALVFSVLTGFAVFNWLEKDLVIIDNGNEMRVKTIRHTVCEALEQNGIEVGSYDYINPPLNETLSRSGVNKILIKRAVPVEVFVDGGRQQVLTHHDKVEDVLKNSSIKLNKNDKLKGVKMDDPVVSGMKIQIVRVTEEIVTEREYLPYEMERRRNRKMLESEEKVVEEGREGIVEYLYKVVFEDSKEIARELISSRLITEPINRIVEVGTLLSHKTSRGEDLKYKEVIDAQATAYTSSYEDTGKHPDHPYFGMTYTGVKARRGIIAVDPNVIPLGSRVYVEIAGSTPDYGYALAADTGGAIKGNKIDVYVDTREEALRWGVKKCKVYILED